MRPLNVLVTLELCLAALPSNTVWAEELKGAARREYERVTSEGSFYTSCDAHADYAVFWAGQTPSVLNVDGRRLPVSFDAHKIGDYIKKPYLCQTAEGVLKMTMTLTHSISEVQCGAGNRFMATLSMAHHRSFSDHFLVDGCGATLGLLVRGEHVLLCTLPNGDKSLPGECAEGADAAGPRALR